MFLLDASHVSMFAVVIVGQETIYNRGWELYEWKKEQSLVGGAEEEVPGKWEGGVTGGHRDGGGGGGKGGVGGGVEEG